jgi:hypothetical protein
MPLVSPAGESLAKTRIQTVVRQYASESPRSTQRAIGPSQIGETCDRRVMYQLLDMEPSKTDSGDPWPAVVGTAVHAWLANAFEAENERTGKLRYLVETKVKLTDGIGGTCDLFDLYEREVIDHKVLGTTTMRKIKSGNIPPRYRTQLHLYGYGFTLAGLDVSTVSLALYPRSGWLDDLYRWSEPYDESVAVSAMDRLANLTTAAYALKLDERMDLWSMVPAQPGADCTWCPFWRPGVPVDGHGCPGPEVPGV